MVRMRTSQFSIVSMFLLATMSAQGQTDLSKFPLSKGIPADAFVAVAARANPERQFLHDHWSRVWKAFHESGVVNDVWELISDSMGDEEAEKVEEITTRFHELFTAVDWDAMFSRETVHAGRFVKTFTYTPYEGILLGRGDTDKVAANYEALTAIMKELAKLTGPEGEGPFQVKESRQDDFTKSTLTPTAAPGVGIGVGKWRDVLIIGFGGLNLMDESVKLLSGKTESKGLTSTDRFKQAFAQLPPAEDELSFFDPSTMLAKTKGMIDMVLEAKAKAREAHATAAEARRAKEAETQKVRAAKPADDEEADEEEDEDEPDDEENDNGGETAVLNIVVKVIDELCIIDSIAQVEWTDGLRVHTESRTTLKPDAKRKAMAEVLIGGKPIESFERYIPKSAKNFSVSTGLNWSRLYRFCREFFEANAPGSVKHLAEFDRLQKEEWELDIEKDVIGLLAGGYMSVETAGGSALFLRLTNEEKANSQLDRLFTMIEERTAGEKGGGLMITTMEIAGHPGFRQISHPMMMMMGGGITPVIGCAEGHLIVATSSKIVKLCLETAAGKNPNITKNVRWQKEALRPTGGKLDSISFEDQSAMAEQIQGAIGGFSMALGMVGMFGQDMPPEIKTFFSKVPPILAKLGPVAGKLDFYASTSSYGTFENGVWHERSVQNYKPPRPPESEEGETEGEASQDEQSARPAKPKPAPRKTDEAEDESEQ